MDTSKPKKPGRPTIEDDAALKNVVTRYNAQQRAKIKAGGGSQWLRDLVDAASWPEAKPPKAGKGN